MKKMLSLSCKGQAEFVCRFDGVDTVSLARWATFSTRKRHDRMSEPRLNLQALWRHVWMWTPRSEIAYGIPYIKILS